MQGEEILVPTVELETEIQQSTTFGPLNSFNAYQDLTPIHRFEFIRFLEGNFTPVKSSQAIIDTSETVLNEFRDVTILLH